MTLRSLRIAALASAALMIASTLPVLAQTADPNSTQPTMQSSQAAVPVDTPTFLTSASSSNQFEILSSRIALEKATDPAVKAFADQMIADHTKAGEDMRAAVQAAGVEAVAMPEGEQDLMARHKEMLDSLARAETNFDAAYVRLQYQAHTEAVSLFSGYAESGDQSAIRDFAAATLPTLTMHLEHVSALPGAPTVDPATGSVGSGGGAGNLGGGSGNLAPGGTTPENAEQP